jgi:D-alanyl-D-alanine carboxypeptidase
MDGVADIHARMSQISAQLAALAAGSSPVRPPGANATGTSTATTSGSTTADTASGTTPFDSVLAAALSDQQPAELASAGATTGGTAATATDLATTAADPSASAGLIAARMALTGLPTAPAATSSAAAASAAAPTTAAASSPAAATASAAPVAAPAASYPTDLSSYGNGRIPTAALKPLGVGDHRLWAPAADQFRAMRAAAARDGVHIGVNDSYRSYADQVDMARRKGLYSQGGLAAAPGTSEHGLGKSVDLQLDGQALSWMRTHADDYGFRNNVPRECWHWTYTARS